MPIFMTPTALDRAPDVICVGDSWFWHPAGNLTPEFDNIFAGKAILLIGDSGKEAADLVNSGQRYFDMFKNALTDGAQTLTHVFISAGGNDFAGFDDFASVLNADCSNAASPAACYNIASMTALFTQIFSDIEKLIDEVEARAPHAEVRLHNYDYAIPDGRHVGGTGQWLKVPMDACQVPDIGGLARGGFRREVVATLIDTFGHWQEQLATRRTKTRFIRTAGSVPDSGWLDELHPKAAGFRKIARILAA